VTQFVTSTKECILYLPQKHKSDTFQELLKVIISWHTCKMIFKNIHAFTYILTMFFSLIVHSEIIREDIEFKIYCKVLDNVVIKMEDGKSNRFGGYENGVEVGDTIFVEFDFSNVILNEKNFYEIDVTSNIGYDNMTFRSRIKVDDFSTSTSFEDMFTFDGTHFWFLSNDQIEIGGFSGDIKMNRYYKNDWNIIVDKGFQSSSQIISGNCMNVSNKYNAILNVLSAEHNKK